MLRYSLCYWIRIDYSIVSCWEFNTQVLVVYVVVLLSWKRLRLRCYDLNNLLWGSNDIDRFSSWLLLFKFEDELKMMNKWSTIQSCLWNDVDQRYAVGLYDGLHLRASSILSAVKDNKSIAIDQSYYNNDVSWWGYSFCWSWLLSWYEVYWIGDLTKANNQCSQTAP